MKTKLFLLALIFAFSLEPSALHAQGSLTPPPGVPAPTMITLSQMEPRAPISSAPITITQPGSYYLTTNLSVTAANAITIVANNVTLDLNGFAISSTAPGATGYGIELGNVNATTNISIFNGFISSGVTNNAGTYSGSGFAYGIAYSGAVPPRNVRVRNVSVTGCLDNGIYLPLGSSTVVESCTVSVVGSYGIQADSVSRSTAIACGYAGVVAETASDCVGDAISQAVLGYYTLNNCFGSSAGGVGIYCNGGANNCYGTTTTGSAVQCGNAGNCYGYSTGNGIAVNAGTALNCYGYTPNGSGYGIFAYVANDSFGYSITGTGIYAFYVATGSYGYSYSGTGINAFIASVCHGATVTGTALTTSHNVYSY